MALVTTNSTFYTLYEGTAQEVLDALDDKSWTRFVSLGRDGTGAYYALVKKN